MRQTHVVKASAGAAMAAGRLSPMDRRLLGGLHIVYRDFRESASRTPPGQIDRGLDAASGMAENFFITMEADQ